MSEYQYYEFLAIDRPLTLEEMSALRRLSTRAHITPVSFKNEYNWGDFKGDPVELMRRYFDAHVYVANWMTAIFMVRLPIEVLPKKTAQAMALRDFLDFDATENYWLITWRLEESENCDRFALEDGRDWMARLAPVRDELLQGDIRSLYIGWLAAVSREIVDDDELEPIMPDGLRNLTSAQRALVEYIELDEDLLEGACMGASDLQDKGPTQQEMNDWLEGLPHDEVLVLLKQLLEGHGSQAGRNFKNRFSAWRRSKPVDMATVSRRTVGELIKNADTVKKKRLEQKKKKQARLAAKRARKHGAYLMSLAKDFPKAWSEVQKMVDRGSGPAYKEACHALINLSEAYVVHASKILFYQDLKTFMTNNLRRKALIKRLVKAGLWHET